MDERIKKVFEVEKAGKYEVALEEYLQIPDTDLSDEDCVFLQRSIAACYYYLKKYEEAKSLYSTILKNDSLDKKIRKEVQVNFILCYLYGGQTEIARELLLEEVESIELTETERCWYYWYLGQCDFLLTDYVQMGNFYLKCVNLARIIKYDKLSFFLCHLALSALLNSNYKELNKCFREIESMEDRSFGLFKIILGIHKYLCGQIDWLVVFNDGLDEAEAAHYLENLNIADFLYSKYCSKV